MEDRLKHVLGLVVAEAIRTGEPVGSQYLVDTYDLDVSPATIRNWFAELEAEGYVAQPHTSSGRMPTEKGYRLYVNEIMETKPLPRRERHLLDGVGEAATEPDRRAKELAKTISESIGNAVILGLNRNDSYYTGLSQLFSQQEFKDWNRVVNLGEVLDRLDDVLDQVRRERYPAPHVFLGQECPFGSACGSVLLTLPDGNLMAILGPMRMDYALGISLLNATREILQSYV